MAARRTIPGRWYADNTREPIRDETIRFGLISVGAVLEQEGLIEPPIQGAITTENVDDIINRIKNTILDVSTAYNELLKKLE